MKDLSGIIYSPAIRTRRAELKGLVEVRDPLSRGLLPLFELTRSRRTKKNPEGAVGDSIAEVLSFVNKELFVVDLTSLDSLLNAEVQELLDPDENFRNWREFTAANIPSNGIPVAHLTDPFDAESMVEQISEFAGRHQGVALRIPAEFSELGELSDVLGRKFGDLSSFVVFADVGMVSPRARAGALARANEIVGIFEGMNPAVLAPLASSFPSAVTQLGGDEHGNFELQEVFLSEALKLEYEDLNCVHGDYACIHPLDIEGMAINWVPRVDVPLDNSLYYYRYRRNDGSYTRAAKAAIDDRRYVPLDCWAHNNIVEAAGGSPQGKSPSHWISVRLNYHIERQLTRLGA